MQILRTHCPKGGCILSGHVMRLKSLEDPESLYWDAGGGASESSFPSGGHMVFVPPPKPNSKGPLACYSWGERIFFDESNLIIFRNAGDICVLCPDTVIPLDIPNPNRAR